MLNIRRWDGLRQFGRHNVPREGIAPKRHDAVTEKNEVFAAGTLKEAVEAFERRIASAERRVEEKQRRGYRESGLVVGAGALMMAGLLGGMLPVAALGYVAMVVVIARHDFKREPVLTLRFRSEIEACRPKALEAIGRAEERVACIPGAEGERLRARLRGMRDEAEEPPTRRFQEAFAGLRGMAGGLRAIDRESDRAQKRGSLPGDARNCFYGYEESGEGE